ncbi:MAG: hypothetical protein LBI01_04700, partial [Elusimicrobium sp.]|nr:hypothetical protein [Elusimicrobium sp.]
MLHVVVQYQPFGQHERTPTAVVHPVPPAQVSPVLHWVGLTVPILAGGAAGGLQTEAEVEPPSLITKNFAVFVNAVLFGSGYVISFHIMPGLIFARLLFAAVCGVGKSCLFVLPDSDIINPSIRCNSPPVVTPLPKVWLSLKTASGSEVFSFLAYSVPVPIAPEPTVTEFVSIDAETFKSLPTFASPIFTVPSVAVIKPPPVAGLETVTSFAVIVV